MPDRAAKTGSGSGAPGGRGAPGAIAERVRAMAEPVARSYGLEIFDVAYRRESYGFVLRVQIDRPGPAATADESVSVDDCAHVSRDRPRLAGQIRHTHPQLPGSSVRFDQI